MNDIRSILRIAARRLETGSFLFYLHIAGAVLGILVVILLVAERLGAARFWPWGWMLPVLGGVGILAAVFYWSRRRLSEVQVAVEVDERLDLREKLSTALHVAKRSDPFARAAIEDAVGTARDPKVRQKVRRLFAVQSPNRWWLSPLMVLIAVGLWFVPQLNLFDREASANMAVAETVKQSNEAIQAVIKPIEENAQLKEELSDLLGELTNEGVDPDALKSREQVQREAIKKLTDINKRLDDILNGPKGKTMESLKKSLEQIKPPQDGPAKELAEAMANGDFQAAQKALEKLMEDVAGGDLTEEQKEQLARQLADIAEQLEQIAKNQQALEQMLEQAGLNPQLAQNPEALAEALANNPNLNEQQKQQLQQMAQAQQAAGMMCRNMGQAMGRMAQNMQMGQMGQGSQQMAGQLSELEAMQQFLQQARAAANAAQGQCKGLGKGLGMNAAMRMWMDGRGGAFGNRGQGAGGKAPISPTPTGTRITQAPSQHTPGDIIARQFIDGPQIVGESKTKLSQVATAVNQGFDEAQEDETIPRKYFDAQKHYFGEFKKRVEAVQRADKPAETSGEKSD